MKIKINQLFSDYELIDCGDGEKLERFGNKVIIRPDISAVNNPAMERIKWTSVADAQYKEDSATKGKWFFLKSPFEQWDINYNTSSKNLKIRLQLSSFKHVGIFPEQAVNWKFLGNVSDSLGNNLQFLNLFGYTGVASMVAAERGHLVTHVDALKQVTKRGKMIMTENGIDGIRWITEDAVRFVERAMNRGNRYDGIILDPPAVGKGPNGEIWKMEKQLDDLLNKIRTILQDRCFIIMNLYSHNADVSYTSSLMSKYFPDFQTETFDRLLGESRFGNTIDHGIIVRLLRN